MGMANVDATELEVKVKEMYRLVAEEPDGAYHFEMGRKLAEHLGYPIDLLDQIPAGAIESFAGVGYFLDLASLRPGELVMDLGSGSGMDSFIAAVQVGSTGRVLGIDFTTAQLATARRLAADAGVGNVEFRECRIDALPAEATDSVDCVISNGVINLSPDKELVFREAARVLRPGGRLAVADIVTQKQLSEAIVCNADLWASCIGGAAQLDGYRNAIERAGLRIEQTSTNPYQFNSDQALGASAAYGVHSISVLAVKPAR
jgi:SAM-dependent methyltransferase